MRTGIYLGYFVFFGSVNLGNKEIDQNFWLKKLSGKVKILAWVRIPAIIQNHPAGA